MCKIHFTFSLSRFHDHVCVSYLTPNTVPLVSQEKAFDLKSALVPDPTVRQAPLTFHERKSLILPVEHSLLQKNLLNIEKFAEKNLMVINEKKTNVMLFNVSKSYSYPPEYSFANGNILQVVEKTKLLGVHLNSNLSWNDNTAQIIKKAMKKMWLLRRMKNVQLDVHIIFDYYLKEIRPIVEYASPVWNSGLTLKQSYDIERTQKVALKIILGRCYNSYSDACSFFQIDTLADRREKLSVKFAVKTYRGERRRQFFNISETERQTRKKKLVIENFTRTKRCFNAPHNALARILNENAALV